MGIRLSLPWRDVTEDKEESLKFLKSYRPENSQASHVRILLHGPVGAGKSSFINSVDSLLQNKVTSRALTDVESGSSFTRQYKTYKIRKDQHSFYSFIFNDIMGLEKGVNHGVHVEDLKLALRGHMKDGYKFQPEHQMKQNDPHYNPSPTLDDKVHVLVSVVPASSVSLLSDEIVRKMREVRLTASDMGIPQLAVLTKVDEACPEAKGDIDNVYKSMYLKDQVEQFSRLLGLPVNWIFLVKNYESEIRVNDAINRLILCALREMINFGEDFLNDQ